MKLVVGLIPIFLAMPNPGVEIGGPIDQWRNVMGATRMVVVDEEEGDNHEGIVGMKDVVVDVEEEVSSRRSVGVVRKRMSKRKRLHLSLPLSLLLFQLQRKRKKLQKLPTLLRHFLIPTRTKLLWKYWNYI